LYTVATPPPPCPKVVASFKKLKGESSDQGLKSKAYQAKQSQKESPNYLISMYE